MTTEQNYYGWMDDNAKKPTVAKIAEACDAYERRFGRRPNLVLCNPEQVEAVAGVTVRGESFIRRNNFWAGWEATA